MFKITIDFTVGTDITGALEEARRLARQLNCRVNFNFNEKEFSVGQDFDTKEILQEYHTSKEKLIVRP
jgi:predicted RNA-binding protein associated with RNAse of E/G family